MHIVWVDKFYTAAVLHMFIPSMRDSIFEPVCSQSCDYEIYNYNASGVIG
jgi:hypothetical protein